MELKIDVCFKNKETGKFQIFHEVITEEDIEILAKKKIRNKMKQARKLKTVGQVMDEINQMNDGSIMEIYKVQGGFKTKFQSGWTSLPAERFCSQCGNVMKFTGKALLSNPQQYEYRCEKCESIRYILDNQYK